ncbi:outer membrane beta-barrel domain-containing protein [Colwellia echini]|uniref:Outer membrane beta-barrel domain-containing protein n=1 Tax=Colwellia echini TaxID=1982103 RepID=A0ABY3MWI6_9GAMM|nr:outer membrane beta-barrel domain-containing protein [Colwellia echini]TYK65407.1 outer membrane beta-barrel domain-containing protein [Colwellia echini]
METRFQRILLAVSLSLLITISWITPTQANEKNNSTVDVDVERRDVLEDILDNENFEVGVQIGIMSIEDFGTNTWVSAHFSYHITEFFYAKALYGQSEAGTTSFENLVNVPPLLTDEQRKLSYYGLNIGYNLMPGEVFLGRDFALNSVFSIELGGGTTTFAGDEKFTVNFGVNQRLFLNDWIAWDIGMSDYIFDTDIAGENKTTHNLNFTTGFAFYF